MCTGVWIFKIFVCSVLQLLQTVWTWDLKCGQWQKYKYLWWTLFRCLMPIGFSVFQQITFAFMSCLVLSLDVQKKKELFGLYLVFLLCYYYPFHIIIFSFLLFDQFDECFIFSLINESFLKRGNNIYYCLSFLFFFLSFFFH